MSRTCLWIACAIAILVFGTDVGAHGVSAADKTFMEKGGLVAFLYLGAKHMVTGYDHLLFLFGVIFFLYKLRDVGVYVTLFAVGHSVTLRRARGPYSGATGRTNTSENDHGLALSTNRAPSITSPLLDKPVAM